MDNHAELICMFVKRSIESNLSKLNEDEISIKNGGLILWKEYYRNVYYGIETVTNVKQRMENDLKTKNMVDLKAYLDRFWKF
jgi:hypothetical protein